MSQFSGKRTNDIAIRQLPSLRFGVTLLWLEDMSSLSKERDERVDRLCAVHSCQIFRYTSLSKCLKYLKKAKSYERIIVVININNCSITTSDISRLVKYRQIQSVFMVALVDDTVNDVPIDLSDFTRDEMNKISGLFHDYEALFDPLQKLLNEANETDDDFFSFFNRPEKSFQDLRLELGRYIWSQSLRVVLKSMSYNSSEAKRDMLVECRACCYNNPCDLAMVDEFQRTYHRADAILWYTKPCFLHRLINRALRTGDIFALYKFRYFIVDLCLRLEETSLTSIHHTKPFRVYRGSRLGRDEVEKLRVGSLVATNGFFSSSRCLDVALRFAGIDPDTGMSPSRGRNDRCQYVLFEVDIDLNNSPEIVVNDVSRRSVVPDENELLFNLGTTFVVNGIIYHDEHRLWYIRMITTSEMAEVKREYCTYTLERCTAKIPAISFGQITCEHFSDYPQALNYLHCLLRTKTLDDDDHPDVHYCLARVYRAIGKYEQAIEYCRRTQLLVRRRSVEFSMTYGRTLVLLGVVHSDLENLELSMHYHQRAATIYRRTLPQNHGELAIHMNRIAYVYWQNKQYQSALAVLTNALPLIKKALPTHYPSHAQTLHIMGLVQYSLNNREQALQYFKQSLKMRESFQAIDHPHVARTCYELSKLYEERGDYPIALDYAQRSLCIRKAKLPRSHKELKQSIELVERLSLLNNAISSDP